MRFDFLGQLAIHAPALKESQYFADKSGGHGIASTL
jgi:hypothetical protein